MITIIAATNRKGSNTRILAEHYFQNLQSKTKEPVKFLSLEDIPHDLLLQTMYSKDKISPDFTALESEFITPADKFVVIAPEYNGSFPGVFKLFLDAASIRDRNANFKGKKLALVGVSTGRAGNLRGLEHLTSIFNYFGTILMPNILPISVFHTLLDSDKKLVHQPTIDVLDAQAEMFLAF